MLPCEKKVEVGGEGGEGCEGGSSVASARGGGRIASPPPRTSATMAAPDETKVIYYVDDEETPYLVKLAAPPHAVTLADFKSALNRPNHKYFFKSMDDDFGVVKEEIADDRAHLPCFNGRVVGWLVSSCEGSNPSDGGSQGDKDGGARQQQQQQQAAQRRPPRSLDDKFRYKGLRINGHSKFAAPSSRLEYETASVLSSELDSVSLFDSQSETTGSGRSGRAATDCSSVSHLNVAGRRRRRKLRPQAVSRASSYSSITDSTMSLNIITVSLNMDTVNFLGISIVGQSNKGGDGGIYVGSIMKGGAVALDGRIEPGDMILQVNDVNFENMSNDEAVRVLREVVQKPGPIKLVVAKCWDPNPKGYFTIPRTEPVRPIDPGAWVAHTAAIREAAYPAAPPSVLGGSGGSLASVPTDQPPPLSVNMDMAHVVRTMLRPDSGLEIRDRMWLKITIPNAFIGADVVEWVLTRVAGISDRREARKYASRMLKAGFIRHTVNKVTFSEQCYYVAGDGLCAGLNALRLGARSPSADSDTVAPLPNPSLMGPTNYMPYSGSYNPHGYQPMPFKYTSCPASEHTTIYGYNREESMLSGSGGSSGSDHLTAKEHHGNQDGKSNSSGSQGETSTIPPTIPTGNGNNNGTGSSSGGRRSHSSGSDRGMPPDHSRPVIFL